jgi:MFS family permease
MSPIASYRRLFSLAGPLYVLVAFVGRLPLAMSQMGTLLLVAGTTGSYALGGGAAGALAVANAAGAPAAGALADRVGQRPVVLVQSVLGGVGLLVLVGLATGGATPAAVIAAAAAAGLAMPQIGPLARVRWRPMTRHQGEHQPRLMETAFSYEGAADEASFVLGPALIGVLAVVASPALAVSVAAVILLGFGTAFALHHTAALAHAHRPTGPVTGRIITGAFVVLLLAQLLIGVVFGSVQTGTTALTTAAGQPGLAGLVHATLGVGSVVAGLAVAALPARIGFPTRVLVTAVGLAVLSTPLLGTHTVPRLFVVVLVLGFVVAPYMISVFVLGERAVPSARVGTAMTLLASVTGVGYALGSAVAGRLADLHGETGAFAVTVAAAATAALLAATTQPVLRGVAAPRAAERVHDAATGADGPRESATRPADAAATS